MMIKLSQIVVFCSIATAFICRLQYMDKTIGDKIETGFIAVIVMLLMVILKMVREEK